MGVLALLVHVAVGVSSVLLIVRVSSARPAAPYGGAHVHDVHEAAFLSGGPARVVDSALAAMHADGRIAIGGPGVLSVLRPVAQDPVERAVLAGLAAAPTGALHSLRLETMRSPAVQEIGDVLSARGLMVPPGHGSGLAAWGVAQSVGCAVGVPVALVMTFVEVVGTSGGSGLPFVFMVFPVLVAGTLIGAFQANRARRRVTPAGLGALRAYRAAHALPQSPGEAVALHGPRGAADPALRDQLSAAARYRTGAVHSPSSGALHTGEAVWCAGVSPGSGCGSSGGGSGSGCGGSSGSGCGGSSGSSCGSSSGSSCGGSGGGS